MSDMSLMTVTSPEGRPDIARAAEILRVPAEAIDQGFGIVPIDAERGLYAVQVRTSALPGRDPGEESAPYRGPFSNPRIEGFGPEGDDR